MPGGCQLHATDPSIVAGLFPPQVRVAIAGAPMSEHGLLPGEANLVSRAVPERRREFAAGRNAARVALRELGYAPSPILRSDDRAPAWPAGAVGSITHCAGFVCAVAARSARFVSLGVDAEITGRMEPGMDELICSAEELSHIATLPEAAGGDWATIVFSAKEATYKCLSPLIDELLDFKDVSLRFFPDETRRRGWFAIADCSAASGLDRFRIKGTWTLADAMVLCGAHIARANPAEY